MPAKLVVRDPCHSNMRLPSASNCLYRRASSSRSTFHTCFSLRLYSVCVGPCVFFRYRLTSFHSSFSAGEIPRKQDAVSCVRVAKVRGLHGAEHGDPAEPHQDRSSQGHTSTCHSVHRSRRASDLPPTSSEATPSPPSP